MTKDGNDELTPVTVPGAGALRVAARTDPDRGHVSYVVSGPRVAGPVVVRPVLRTSAHDDGNPEPLRLAAPPVAVHLGSTDIDDEAGCLRVNGVPVAGAVVLSQEAVRSGQFAARLWAYGFMPRRWTPSGMSRDDLPSATWRRAALIVAALAGLWLERPDRGALCDAAARLAEPDYARSHAELLDTLRERRHALAEEIAVRGEHLAAARALLHDPADS